MSQYKSQFIDIDPDTCTKEELKAALDKLHSLEGYYETKQLAIKTFLNSVYGACASKYFVGHNTMVAEAITLQGQDLNHFSENSVNAYFNGIFQSDEEYHKTIYVPLFEYLEKYPANDSLTYVAKNPNTNEWVVVNLPISCQDINEKKYDDKMKGMLKKVSVKTEFGPYLGITIEQAKAVDINKGRLTEQLPLDHKELAPYFRYLGKPTFLQGNPKVSLTIAGDTDSIYVEFGRISNQCGFIDNDKASRFVVDLWNYSCGPYMDRCYEAYAKKYNCNKNLQVLELEKIADTAVMVAKKHYAMSECFLEPNIYVKPGEHVLYKGLELVQGACPPYSRKCQDDFYRFLMDWYQHHTEQPPIEILIDKVKKYKEDFMKQKPDDICKCMSIGDYNKFIVDDNQTLAIGEKCPIQIRCAGTYNYFLNNKYKKYRAKYNKIRQRDKVRFYKTTDPNYPGFAFLPGKFPMEFAPAIDYNQQFSDLILSPINRVLLDIFKYQELSSDLCYTTPLF